MIRAEHIVVYRCGFGTEWHRYYVTADWNEALERAEAAKKTVPDITEVAIKTTFTQTQIAGYWRKME